MIFKDITWFADMIFYIVSTVNVYMHVCLALQCKILKAHIVSCCQGKCFNRVISKGHPHACPLTTLAINIYGPQCLINIVLTIKCCHGQFFHRVISWMSSCMSANHSSNRYLWSIMSYQYILIWSLVLSIINTEHPYGYSLTI